MEKKYGKHDQINTRTSQKIRGWKGIAIIPNKLPDFEDEDQEGEKDDLDI